jgi:hypothetical protein
MLGRPWLGDQVPADPVLCSASHFLGAALPWREVAGFSGGVAFPGSTIWR